MGQVLGWFGGLVLLLAPTAQVLQLSKVLPVLLVGAAEQGEQGLVGGMASRIGLDRRAVRSPLLCGGARVKERHASPGEQGRAQRGLFIHLQLLHRQAKHVGHDLPP